MTDTTDWDVFQIGADFAREAVARTVPSKGHDMRQAHELAAREYLQRHYDGRRWRVISTFGRDAESAFLAGISDALPVEIAGTPIRAYKD